MADQTWQFPLAMTPGMAEAFKEQIAQALRDMAAAIDSGSFSFRAGDTFTISMARVQPAPWEDG